MMMIVKTTKTAILGEWRFVMTDQLVKLLNQYGYQPVFLPKTGITPPELYSFTDHKLIRLGALSAYFPKPVAFQPKNGKMGNIEGEVTSGKSGKAAIGFLQNALAVLGLNSLPKIDLSFAGTDEFRFAFTNVTYQAVDPAVLGPMLQSLTLDLSIPDEYIEADAMHVAYEYAYATSLTMVRADRREFSTNVSGGIGQYVDLGVGGKTQVTSNSAVTLSSSDSNTAAFAYKAGRLHKRDHRWTFEPEVIKKGLAAGPPAPYLPAPTVVLRLEDIPVAEMATR
jgi:hypothetical protein